MMKKTMFLKFYRLTLIGIFYDMAFFAVWIFLRWCSYLMRTSTISEIGHYANFVVTLPSSFWNVSMILMFLVMFAICGEIINRFQNDDWLNLLNSIKLTVALHRFLYRRDLPLKGLVAGIQMTNGSERIIKGFNHAVSKSVIDIRNDKAFLVVKLPQAQQAQKIFREIDPQIREYLSSRLDEYYFSAHTQFKNKLWYEGKKR